MDDPRRRIPRTDRLLADPRLADLSNRRGYAHLKAAIERTQAAARRGEIAPEDIVDAVLAASADVLTSLTPVLNATGVVVHTNIGRAPLAPDVARAVAAATGYVELEMDLTTGSRTRRGAALIDRLVELVPSAEAAWITNNCAAALALTTTALAQGKDLLIARGEFVEIGDGFRLSDLIESTGVRILEVGTTNRTYLRDYAAAVTARTAAVLKVHPSNFRVSGFTSATSIGELSSLGLPVIVDTGSGLLSADPLLPDEPDVDSALAAGADLVLCSADKLLGGPQAGLIFGRCALIDRIRRYPLARAMRVDKLTIAALEAAVQTEPPVSRYRRLTPEDLRQRTAALAERTGGTVVAHEGRIGGGGAPGVPLHGLAVRLPGAEPERLAYALRTGSPAVLPVVSGGGCLIDLRCVPPSDDESVLQAVLAALAR